MQLQMTTEQIRYLYLHAVCIIRGLGLHFGIFILRKLISPLLFIYVTLKTGFQPP